MDTTAIGRRIAYWRERRRFTQAEFGRLMNGRSQRWVQFLEAGGRQADPRLSVLEDAARVLSVDLLVLLTDTPVTECVDDVELARIRAALQSHNVITGTADSDPAAPLPVDVLRARVRYGWTAFQSSHFASLGRLVPELLVAANQAAARHRGDDQLAAFRSLSMALQLTEAAAIKFGDSSLATIAGHRAVAAAERSGDPVTMASACRHLADAMTNDGQARAAAEFSVAAAARLEAELTGKGDAGLSTLGMLYLKGAMARAVAAERDDRRAAQEARAIPDLLDQAAEYATELGGDGNALFTAYGPTNVKLYRIATHIQLSQGADAVAVALDISRDARAALPRERRAHFLADLARAYTQAGSRENAVDTLLEAEKEAKEEVLCRPRTRQLVEDLRLLGAGSADRRLRALAVRCGLPE
ncbi:helix-turn-helix domain-containing protein [Streptomyces chartreusis]|uniref:Helix-turn-helix transcriptional regulator n=1 Tax=Streptomyces chartreusis TaxID=1969 RepID=A0A7H8TK30_STRCX|nr:helix-turn-helix transcriptional regulator [Streptomyces chartreusis]QKZ23883.1 helix-turn-helix transcriptional regulator [Streptomyces chartreusis]